MKRIFPIVLLLLCAALFSPQPAEAQELNLLKVRSHCNVPFLSPLYEPYPAPGVTKKTTPVVIVGGTLAIELLYIPLEIRLGLEGYSVIFFPLPEGGLIDINDAADRLACVVDHVLSTTHAAKVHMIGHSQGVLTTRVYIANYNAENKVETVVSLAGPNQGTLVTTGTFLEYPLPSLLGCYEGVSLPPCVQLSSNSPMVNFVNSRPIGSVYYTNFGTTDDDWIVPYENSFMPFNCDKVNGRGELLTCNVHIQDYCPNLPFPITHISMPNELPIWNGIKQALAHQPINLCGTLPPTTTPSNLECETTEVREPVSGLASYPRAVARVPADKLAQGFVRVGGGCEVSQFGTGSVHAAVMVENGPHEANGWACKAADPALIINPAWARSTVHYCRIEPKVDPAQRLECQTLAQTSALAFNPIASVTLPPTMVADGYKVISGGCTSSYFGNGSVHAESVVRSTRNFDELGWTCQGADPPNNPQLANVTATLVACRSKIDAGARNTWLVEPELQCQVTKGPLVTGFGPQSTINTANPGRRILGGECELSWALHGSIHAEFMVKNGLEGFSGWTCKGADPPLTPNLAHAQATAISCNVSLGVKR